MHRTNSGYRAAPVSRRRGRCEHDPNEALDLARDRLHRIAPALVVVVVRRRICARKRCRLASESDGLLTSLALRVRLLLLLQPPARRGNAGSAAATEPDAVRPVRMASPVFMGRCPYDRHRPSCPFARQELSGQPVQPECWLPGQLHRGLGGCVGGSVAIYFVSFATLFMSAFFFFRSRHQHTSQYGESVPPLHHGVEREPRCFGCRHMYERWQGTLQRHFG